MPSALPSVGQQLLVLTIQDVFLRKKIKPVKSTKHPCNCLIIYKRTVLFMCLGKIFNSPRNEKGKTRLQRFTQLPCILPPWKVGHIMERPWNQRFNLWILLLLEVPIFSGKLSKALKMHVNWGILKIYWCEGSSEQQICPIALNKSGSIFIPINNKSASIF